MRAALLRLASTAWADHGGPLRTEGLSPLTVGLLAAALTLAVGVLIVVIVMLLTRKPSSPAQEPAQKPE
jgi:hypothetical protein